jgi:molybdenum cofactor cytidylyltransferase
VTQNLFVLVLAAGQSQRFGATKLLEEFDGRPLLQHALAVGQEACPGRVCLVTGHASEEMAKASIGLADQIVLNNNYESGIGSSIAIGVSHLINDASAVIILLADQPLVTSSHVKKLVNRWNNDAGAIVATRFSGVDGPPVLFGQSFFDQLSKLEGDAGARQILQAWPDAVRSVDFQPAAVDVDTPGDLEALLSQT